MSNDNIMECMVGINLFEGELKLIFIKKNRKTNYECLFIHYLKPENVLRQLL